jgi:hypothetical protein
MGAFRPGTRPYPPRLFFSSQTDVAAIVFGDAQRANLIRLLDKSKLQLNTNAPIQISPANRQQIFEFDDGERLHCGVWM